MATLTSGQLSFNFQYTNFEEEWVQYEFFFLWQGKPIIRDSALKEWSARSKHAFVANDDLSDSFLPFLKKILKSDLADYWEPIEPDIMVALYPDRYFPFLKSHLTLISESDERKQQRKIREALKEEKKQLPDDIYTFIAFVDAYNFKGSQAYYGQGFSMHMIVTRQQLESFAHELEAEYTAFKERFKLT